MWAYITEIFRTLTVQCTGKNNSAWLILWCSWSDSLIMCGSLPYRETMLFVHLKDQLCLLREYSLLWLKTAALYVECLMGVWLEKKKKKKKRRLSYVKLISPVLLRIFGLINDPVLRRNTLNISGTWCSSFCSAITHLCWERKKSGS